MRRIYWDTMLFAYWLEEREPYAGPVGEILTKIEARGDRLITSVLTLGETMVGPWKRGHKEVAIQVAQFFRPPRVELVAFTADMAQKFATLRADYAVSPADAIHLATAATVGVDLFMTNDKQLLRLPAVEGIRFFAGLEGIVF